MTFLSYLLPEGAPQRMVWFAECDVCKSKHLGPFPNAPKVVQRDVIEAAGWRYQQVHPMDTCTACLPPIHTSIGSFTRADCRCPIGKDHRMTPPAEEKSDGPRTVN